MNKIKLSKKKKIFITILILFSLLFCYFTVYYYRDLIFGPPVLFIKDEYIEIGLYPYNFQSATVFTVDDVHKLTEPEKVKKVVDILNKYDIKGVFFVIPYYKGRHKLTKEDNITKTLMEITLQGHEIAQHGLTHWVPRKKPKIINPAKEFVDLPYGEQRRRIYVGRKILQDCGFHISGFRAPAFSANFNTLKILDSLDFLYGANASIYPPPLMMANKKFAESIYYPFHPKDLNLIEFIDHGDFFWIPFDPRNLMVIRNRFEKSYNKKGIFILRSHIEPMNTPRGLALLDRILEHIKSKDLWKPNLTELALWWKAREMLFASSEIYKDTLKIFLEKGNELELNGLTIRIKDEAMTEKYEIINGEGNIIRRGKAAEKIIIIDY